MPKRLFYQVPVKAYLFSKSDDKPEEKVRQWALFELMSAYGYLINSIRIEHFAKIGTKRFPADLVVLRDELPYIVVECKQQEIDYHDDSWDQVLSYANHLEAEYAVWTNGYDWKVKRNRSGKWYAATDIPSRRSKTEAKLSLAKYMQDLVLLARPLYWLNRSIPAQSVPVFLQSLSLVLIGIERDKLSKAPRSLQNAYHDLVWIASEISSSDPFAQNGLLNRLLHVLDGFQKFFHTLDYDGRIPESTIRYDIDHAHSRISSYLRKDDNELSDAPSLLAGVLANVGLQTKETEERSVKEIVTWEITELASNVRFLAQNHDGSNSHTSALLSACEAVLRYVEDFRFAEQIDLSEGQVDQILAVFQRTLLAPLQLYLPTKLDPQGTADLHDLCKQYWENFEKASSTYMTDVPLPDVIVIPEGTPGLEELIQQVDRLRDEQDFGDKYVDEIIEPDDGL